MTIGIDLSPLQGPHRMRGIGSTLINIINNLPTSAQHHKFIFYAYPLTEGVFDPFSILQVQHLDYEVRDLGHTKRSKRVLRGRLNMLVSAYNNLLNKRELRHGDSRTSDLTQIDVFLQIDPNQTTPKKRGVKNIVFVHDIIPYVLSWDYMWSYSFARTRGYSRKAALRCHVRRKLYFDKFRVISRRADKLLANSEQTKLDFHNYLSVPSRKIVVTPLGVNLPEATQQDPALHHYLPTSWGYLPKPLRLDPKTPFLLFVGGADRRRKLEDVVAVFNRLRAQGQEMKLILVGDSMQGPLNISTEEIQHALKTSSYLADIIFMGFVDDASRDWLYRNALAFVFPSKYEGFGLPVLEAMSYGCPVISYENAATKEVAGDCPLYVKNSSELELAVVQLLNDISITKQMAEKGIKQAHLYTWQKTAKMVLAELIS